MSNSISNRTSHSRHGSATCSDLAASFLFPLEEVMSITDLSAAGGPSQAADEVFSFSQPASLEQAGRSLLSTFIHNRLHNSVQTSQCIRLDPLYLLSREQPTFLPTKRTKQLTSIHGTQQRSSTQHSSRQEVCMPSIPAAHEARDLLISLNRQLGPRQVQEPKGYEPCDYPSTAPSASVRGPSRSSCPWL